MRLLRIIFVLMIGLCLTLKAQGAEAHSMRGPAYSSGPYHVMSSVKAGAALASVVTSSQDDEDGCMDGCCACTMGCCAAVLPPLAEMLFNAETTSVVALSCAPLPQGPPFTLLRPPRLTA